MRVDPAKITESTFVTLVDRQTLDELETVELGREFAELLSPGCVVAVFGELGSGKTRFIKGVCAGLEVKQSITSPTFTLINEYRGRLPVYHFDFYRISSLEEAMALGIEEYFYGDGVCLIEWAERISKVLPPDRFEVYLKHLYEPGGENKRWIQVRRVNNF